MKFCADLDLVISTDENGIIEYWDPETYGNNFYFIYQIDFPADS